MSGVEIEQGPSRIVCNENDDVQQHNYLSKNNNVKRMSYIRKAKYMPNAEYSAMIRSLNDAQYSLVMEFIHCMAYEKDRCLQIYLAGPSGTGKSYLIKVLCETANRFVWRMDRNKNAHMVCATTGKAAIAINGATVHSTFRIGIDASKRASLKPSALNSMKCDFEEVRLIIIDEVSMLGSSMLYVIDSRLRSIGPQEDLPFGGYNMLFVGDLRQLPPVKAKPVYLTMRPPNMLQDRMLWQNLQYHELTEVMRQKNVVFARILTKIGNGEMLNENELKEIENRFVDEEDVSGEEFNDVIRIFYENKDVDRYNSESLRKHHDHVVVQAIDTFIAEGLADINEVKTLKLSETSNLASQLILKTDTSYILTNNLDIQDKLVNSLIGKLRYIEYGTNDTNDEHKQVKRLWMEFDSTDIGMKQKIKYSTHAHALKLSKKLVPFERRIAPISIKSKLIIGRRKQFPFLPAQAITVHKSQGSTFERVVYRYHPSHQIALVYVALSRTTSLEGLFLIAANGMKRFEHGRRTTKRFDIVNEYERLSEHRLQTKVDATTKLLKDSTSLTIAYVNTQSLSAHTADLEKDPVLSKADILVLSETWLHQDDRDIVIKEHECVTRFNCNRNKAGGVAIYRSTMSSTTTTELPINITVEDNTSGEGDACIARIEFTDQNGEKIHFYLINVYAKPHISQQELKAFLNVTLVRFNERLRSLYNKDGVNFADESVVLCGDFNIDFNKKGGKIITHLEQQHGFRFITNGIVTTVNGTSIDGVFLKKMNISIMPYMSYFSKHRALIFHSPIPH